MLTGLLLAAAVASVATVAPPTATVLANRTAFNQPCVWFTSTAPDRLAAAASAALERLDRALQALKPRVRQAFLLAQIDGVSIAQIAQQLDVSRATIERDLAKALGVCYRLRYAER